MTVRSRSICIDLGWVDQVGLIEKSMKIEMDYDDVEE